MGDLTWVLSRGFVDSSFDLERSRPMSEDNVEGAAALAMLGGPPFSKPGLSLTVEACLFGGGDIEVSLDNWKAS